MNEGLNLHNSAFALAAISLHFCNTFSWFGWQEQYLMHSIFFYAIRCNYDGAPQSVVRKTKLRASTYKRRNGLIWEHLDERMELLRHLH